VPLVLDIVSPEELLLSTPVEMVVIPALAGDMGVLEGHAPMIVALRGGMVSLYEGDRITASWFILGGFAEVTAERCTVLATQAIRPSDLRQGDADAMLRDAEAAYAALPGTDVDQQQLALDRIDSARAMQEAAAGGVAHP